MADNITTDASGIAASKTFLADEATDGTLGTGVAQYVKVMDGTLNSVNKLIVDSSGMAKVDASGVAVPVTDNAGSLTVDDGGLTLSVDDGGSTVSIDDGGGSITVDGSLSFAPTSTSTATLSNVAASATSVTVLASNVSRKQYEVFNDSTAAMYLKHGSTASTTSFTVKLAAASYYSPPINYTGIVTAVWDSATGNARVTEY